MAVDSSCLDDIVPVHIRTASSCHRQGFLLVVFVVIAVILFAKQDSKRHQDLASIIALGFVCERNSAAMVIFHVVQSW